MSAVAGVSAPCTGAPAAACSQHSAATLRHTAHAHHAPVARHHSNAVAAGSWGLRPGPCISGLAGYHQRACPSGSQQRRQLKPAPCHAEASSSNPSSNGVSGNTYDLASDRTTSQTDFQMIQQQMAQMQAHMLAQQAQNDMLQKQVISLVQALSANSTPPPAPVLAHATTQQQAVAVAPVLDVDEHPRGQVQHVPSSGCNESAATAAPDLPVVSSAAAVLSVHEATYVPSPAAPRVPDKPLVADVVPATAVTPVVAGPAVAETPAVLARAVAATAPATAYAATRKGTSSMSIHSLNHALRACGLPPFIPPGVASQGQEHITRTPAIKKSTQTTATAAKEQRTAQISIAGSTRQPKLKTIDSTAQQVENLNNMTANLVALLKSKGMAVPDSLLATFTLPVQAQQAPPQQQEQPKLMKPLKSVGPPPLPIKAMVTALAPDAGPVYILLPTAADGKQIDPSYVPLQSTGPKLQPSPMRPPSARPAPRGTSRLVSDYAEWDDRDDHKAVSRAVSSSVTSPPAGAAGVEAAPVNATATVAAARASRSSILRQEQGSEVGGTSSNRYTSSSSSSSSSSRREGENGRSGAFRDAEMGPRMRRILSATKWRDLKHWISQELSNLDTAHVSVLLAHLPDLVADRLPLELQPVSANAVAAAKVAGGGRPERVSERTRLQVEVIPAVVTNALPSLTSKLEGDAELQEVRVLAAELATLLTLHLRGLPSSRLAGVVRAVGRLVACPRASWAAAAASATEGFTSSNIGAYHMAECVQGLTLMGASLRSQWITRMWSETGRLLIQPAPAGSSGALTTLPALLSLTDLHLFAQTASALASNGTSSNRREDSRGGAGGGTPPHTWVTAWAASVAATAQRDHAEGEQPRADRLSGESPLVSQARAVVGVLLTGHQLGVCWESEEISALLQLAATPMTAGRSLISTTSAQAVPASTGLQACSAAQLADLAPALSTLPSQSSSPPPSFQMAFVNALWQKTDQLSPRRALRALAAISGWVSDSADSLSADASMQAPVSADASVVVQLTTPLLASFMSSIFPGAVSNASDGAPGAASTSTGSAAVALPVKSLSVVPTAELVEFVGQLSQATSTSTSAQPSTVGGASLESGHMKALQGLLASRLIMVEQGKSLVSGGAVEQLHPDLIASLLVSLAGLLSRTAPAAAVGDDAPVLAGLETSLVFAASKLLKARVAELSPWQLLIMCSALRRAGQAVDGELLEAYLDLLVASPGSSLASSPASLTAVLQALGEARAAGTKPRPGGLGPLLAHCLQVLPKFNTGQLLTTLGALSRMRVTREDTQGVRVTTSDGAPTPGKFVQAVLDRLTTILTTTAQGGSDESSASVLSMDQLAHVTDCVAATGHVPPSPWTRTLLGACQRSLPGASVTALASLMTSLPAIAPQGQEEEEDRKPLTSFLKTCVQQISDGVSQLDLPSLASLMTTVSAAISPSTPDTFSPDTVRSSSSNRADGGPGGVAARFAAAVFEASLPRLVGSRLEAVARLAGALACADVAAPVGWLTALQSASVGWLATGKEAEVAELAWATAKLASATAAHRTSPSASVLSFADGDGQISSGGLILPKWRSALQQRMTLQRMGTGEAYSLPDLARLLWACAAIGIQPRSGLINSFAGKSMDRLSSLTPSLALDAAWACAMLGYQVNDRWLNQWAAAVQGAPIARLGAADLLRVLWALGSHCLGSDFCPMQASPSAGAGINHVLVGLVALPLSALGAPASPPMVASASITPSDYLMSQLAGRLERCMPGASERQEGVLSPALVAHASGLFASLGHVAAPGLAPRLASAAQPFDQLQPGQLVALLWSQAKLGASPPGTWVAQALTALGSGGLAELSAMQLSRLMWALARLPGCQAVASNLPSAGDVAAVVASTVQACVTLLNAPLVPLSTNPPIAVNPGVEGSVDEGEDAQTSLVAPPMSAPLTPVVGAPRRLIRRLVAKQGGGKSGHGAAPVALPTSRGAVGGWAGLLPGDAVDCMWGVAQLSQPMPESWWEQLPGKLLNKVNMLTAAQVCNLLWSAAATGRDLPPAMAADLSKVVATRFATLPAAELADLIYSFAMLRLSLPPAFANMAVKRLQTAMTSLPPRQLARTLWALSRSGYTFLSAQLDSYQKCAAAVADTFALADVALVLQAFSGFGRELSPAVLSQLEARTLSLLQPIPAPPLDPSDLSSSDSPLSTLAVANSPADLVTLLLELSEGGRLPSQPWLQAWAAALPAAALAGLAPQPALRLLDLVAKLNMAGFVNSESWAVALLGLLAPLVSSMDGKRLLRAMSVIQKWDLLYTQAPELTSLQHFPGSADDDDRPTSYADVRAEVIRQLPSQLSLKMGSMDGIGLAEVVQGMAPLGLLHDMPLINRLLNQVSSSLSSLPAAQLPRMASGLADMLVMKPAQYLQEHGQMNLAIKHAELVGVVHKLLNKVLLQAEVQLSMDSYSVDQIAALFSSACSLAKVLEVEEARKRAILAAASEEDRDKAMAQFWETSMAMRGQTAREFMRRTQLADLAVRMGPLGKANETEDDLKERLRVVTRALTKLKGATKQVVITDNDDMQLNLGARVELVENILNSIDDEKAQEEEERHLRSIPNTLGPLEGVWGHTVLSTFFVKVNQAPDVGSIQVVLTALESVGIRLADQEYAALATNAARALHTANLKELALLAFALARCGVEPRRPWLEAFLTALYEAASLPGPDPSKSTLMLDPLSAHQLAYALSMWAPSAIKSNPIQDTLAAAAGAVRFWGDNPINDGFPVNKHLGQALLEGAAQGARSAIYSGQSAAEALGCLCKLSAMQKGVGLTITPVWLEDFLSVGVMPALLSDQEETPHIAPLDLQAVTALLEGLLVVQKRLPPQPLDLQQGVLVALQATAWVNMKDLSKALVALYKLGVKPDNEWMAVMSNRMQQEEQLIREQSFDAEQAWESQEQTAELQADVEDQYETCDAREKDLTVAKGWLSALSR